MPNFHQPMPFLNWLFPTPVPIPQEFPTRFSCKIFPQDFPKLDPDWLSPHHPIPNAKFPPITALLKRPTYHKNAKASPPPLPQISWEPQINEQADSKRASNNHNNFCNFIYRYDSSTGTFTVPPGGDGFYYFSVYLSINSIESAYFDVEVNEQRLCSAVES